jgi:hypothetical protein
MTVARNIIEISVGADHSNTVWHYRPQSFSFLCNRHILNLSVTSFFLRLHVFLGIVICMTRHRSTTVQNHLHRWGFVMSWSSTFLKWTWWQQCSNRIIALFSNSYSSNLTVNLLRMFLNVAYRYLWNILNYLLNKIIKYFYCWPW